MSLVVRPCPSPNHGPRRSAAPPDLVILHYTGMTSADAARDRLCEPAAGVSCHYLIDEEGGCLRLVDDARRAWHAGISCWRGDRDINSRSIGIELVNPGHAWGYRPFPDPQMTCLMALLRDVMARHPIRRCGVLGHSDVAPGRKQDPGELFPWGRLAAAGLALHPPMELTPEPAASWARCQTLAAAVGYDCPQTGRDDPESRAVLFAAQQRLTPDRLTGTPDGVLQARLAWWAGQASPG